MRGGPAAPADRVERRLVIGAEEGALAAHALGAVSSFRFDRGPIEVLKQVQTHSLIHRERRYVLRRATIGGVFDSRNHAYRHRKQRTSPEEIRYRRNRH